MEIQVNKHSKKLPPKQGKEWIAELIQRLNQRLHSKLNCLTSLGEELTNSFS
jgi:hypothetical protein